MSEVEFEPTIPVFEWTKTVHALDPLDCAATVIGKSNQLENWNILDNKVQYWELTKASLIQFFALTERENAIGFYIVRQNLLLRILTLHISY
jgi:hypothetical protein